MSCRWGGVVDDLDSIPPHKPSRRLTGRGCLAVVRARREFELNRAKSLNSLSVYKLPPGLQMMFYFHLVAVRVAHPPGPGR